MVWETSFLLHNLSYLFEGCHIPLWFNSVSIRFLTMLFYFSQADPNENREVLVFEVSLNCYLFSSCKVWQLQRWEQELSPAKRLWTSTSLFSFGSWPWNPILLKSANIYYEKKFLACMELKMLRVFRLLTPTGSL